ncbi:MAG: YqgE/AlgH family protein [Acidimicrobiia bacterium]|nr:MAG: YqgE/AlgH family protein [Acidimicrobiia bacterium]
MSKENFAGQFLVATPAILGPPFERSVILVLEHDSSGAIGVVLNRDSGLLVADVLPDMTDLIADPPHVFIGGPVSTETALCLATSPSGAFIRPSPFDTIGLIDPSHPPHDVSRARVFAGYAGWDPGQLEAELEETAWWVTLADVQDVFGDTTDLWRSTVRRAPGRVPLFGTYTATPARN